MMTTQVSCLSGDANVPSINEAIDREGVVIIDNFFSDAWLNRYNDEAQRLIEAHNRTYTGVEMFDDFLGYNTVRLQGLAAKTPAFVDALIDPHLLAS